MDDKLGPHEMACRQYNRFRLCDRSFLHLWQRAGAQPKNAQQDMEYHIETAHEQAGGKWFLDERQVLYHTIMLDVLGANIQNATHTEY